MKDGRQNRAGGGGASAGPGAESTRRKGSFYEEKAAEVLEQKGYRILDRNFCCRGGELDIVAMDGDVLCFVEVKYRKDLRGGYPQEAVTAAKQKHLYRAAAAWLAAHRRAPGVKCRFDVVGLTDDQFWLIRNAFGGL